MLLMYELAWEEAGLFPPRPQIVGTEPVPSTTIRVDVRDRGCSALASHDSTASLTFHSPPRLHMQTLSAASLAFPAPLRL